jgi:Ca-activated chloride channel family protein
MKRLVVWGMLAFVGCDGAFRDEGTNSGFPVGPLSDLGAPPARAADGAVLPGQGQGTFGNVGVGGGSDFAAFRNALDHGLIPSTTTLDATGFFAEHYTSLPAPTCGQTFCLHGMLSVSPDLARGGDWTLLQMGMNSPTDPSTVQKPPLDIAVVLDRSGSMDGDNKIGYAHQGIDQLIDALGDNDTFTFISFDDTVEVQFGPGKVTDKVALKAKVDSIQPRGSTDLSDALERRTSWCSAPATRRSSGG